MFVLGPDPQLRRHNSATPSSGISRHQQREIDIRDMLKLSHHATLGRNSDFRNLTSDDREKLGGIEYRSLKLLLKIVFCMRAVFGVEMLALMVNSILFRVAFVRCDLPRTGD